MNIFKRFNKKTSESIPNLELPRGTAIMVPIKEGEDNMQDVFKIFTKEDHKRYMLKDAEASKVDRQLKLANKMWNEISKGYNFIIGVGKNDMMFYSVEYFSNEVLGPNQSTVTVKLDTEEFDNKLEETKEMIKRFSFL